jgi:tetratricopeptide (TPR) repeat protein
MVVEALMLFALIQRGNKKFEDAIKTYNEITSIDPNHASALFERAEVYMIQDKALWAEKYYNRALTINPDLALESLSVTNTFFAYLFRNS